MTINIMTSTGEFKVITPVPLARGLKKKIERSLRAVIAEEASKPVGDLLKKLKAEDPAIGTPRGALIAYMTGQGWSQYRLSKTSGIPQGHISQMVAGKRSIGPKIAKKFGEVFGVDYKRFL